MDLTTKILPKGTQKALSSIEKKWNEFIENEKLKISKENLIESLIRFIIQLRKLNGQEYKLKSFYSHVSMLFRFVSKKYNLEIDLKKPEFESLKNVCDNRAREIGCNPKSYVKHHEQMNDAEESRLITLLDTDNPVHITVGALFFLGKHLCLRGGELTGLTLKQLEWKETDEKKYLEYTGIEEKNHQIKFSNPNFEPKRAKLFQGGSEMKDPYNFIYYYYCERSILPDAPDNRFFRAINHKAKKGQHFLRNQAITHGTLLKHFQAVMKEFGISKNVVLHSLRGRSISQLSDAGVEDSQIVQLKSGHRNLGSLLSYKRPNLDVEFEVYSILRRRIDAKPHSHHDSDISRGITFSPQHLTNSMINFFMWPSNPMPEMNIQPDQFGGTPSVHFKVDLDQKSNDQVDHNEQSYKNKIKELKKNPEIEIRQIEETNQSEIIYDQSNEFGIRFNWEFIKKSDKIRKQLTGFNINDFSESFELIQNIFEPFEQRSPKRILNPLDLWLIFLTYFYRYWTFEDLSLTFGMPKSSFHKLFGKYLINLTNALRSQISWITKRKQIKQKIFFPEFLKAIGLMDATFQQYLRPKDSTLQESLYLGKHKFHCLKNLTIHSHLGVIMDCLPSIAGKNHDKILFDFHSSKIYPKFVTSMSKIRIWRMLNKGNPDESNNQGSILISYGNFCSITKEFFNLKTNQVAWFACPICEVETSKTPHLQKVKAIRSFYKEIMTNVGLSVIILDFSVNFQQKKKAVDY
ncbi:hypothetical protein M0811_06208 [Anaeramoeba ignava]|uniref:Tyr recombinase domain-containing protein n=1 Tax=Anaeramoeba ignava TaxID=1746090 RepID=A0A9Q0LSF1_ANAIG|nr:hypothetical protein M0811_06208 [Anaeramoeba ignava]